MRSGSKPSSHRSVAPWHMAASIDVTMPPTQKSGMVAYTRSPGDEIAVVAQVERVAHERALRVHGGLGLGGAARGVDRHDRIGGHHAVLGAAQVGRVDRGLRRSAAAKRAAGRPAPSRACPRPTRALRAGRAAREGAAARPCNGEARRRALEPLAGSRCAACGRAQQQLDVGVAQHEAELARLVERADRHATAPMRASAKNATTQSGPLRQQHPDARALAHPAREQRARELGRLALGLL